MRQTGKGGDYGYEAKGPKSSKGDGYGGGYGGGHKKGPKSAKGGDYGGDYTPYGKTKSAKGGDYGGGYGHKKSGKSAKGGDYGGGYDHAKSGKGGDYGGGYGDAHAKSSKGGDYGGGYVSPSRDKILTAHAIIFLTLSSFPKQHVLKGGKSSKGSDGHGYQYRGLRQTAVSN